VSPTSLKPHAGVPLRPLAETAALFRQECSALDHLVEELYRDVEQLRDDLVRKSDEIEESRKKLAERGRQLAEQRKESGRLTHLLEQQETRLTEAVTQIKSLSEQSAREREESRERETSRFAFLEQKLRTAESERDQVRHELNVLQAAAAANGGNPGSAEGLAPLMTELGNMRRQLSETQSQLAEARTQLSGAIERSVASGGPTSESLPGFMEELGQMRRQLGETQNQLGEARTQLTEAIERATAAAQASVHVVASGDGQPVDGETSARLASIERERVELESELELVRTRATELQEVVNQQRRELVEQRADITTELRLLRELVEKRREQGEVEYDSEDEALVGASARGDSGGSAPDPVVSSVMAQFARLQKDVAQRRKKK
jgi:chromosome segregation ATPase